MTARSVAVAIAALTAALAGCGADTESSSPDTTSVETVAGATDSPASAVAATSVVPAEDRCTADELSLNLGRTDGSAGSVTVPLVFTNTGPRPCILYGFPGVSYVTAKDGTEVGAAATRSGSAGEPATVAPGGRATATVRAVQVENYPESECGPTAVAGLRVYAPDDSSGLFVALPGTGCVLPGVDQLQVTSVASH
ncbi:DUF4232 domain-containing protein [Rhodococcus triatomae]